MKTGTTFDGLLELVVSSFSCPTDRPSDTFLYHWAQEE